MDFHEILPGGSYTKLKRKIRIDFGVIVHYGGILIFNFGFFFQKLNYLHQLYSSSTDLAGDALKIGCFKHFICSLCIFPMMYMYFLIMLM